MRSLRICFVIGILILLFSISFLPPLLIAWWMEDGMALPFTNAFATAIILGSALALLGLKAPTLDIRIRDGLLIVVLFWLSIGLCGSLPFLLTEHITVSLSDAVFESFSGLTTTGATIFDEIDSLPASLLYYRQQTQWLGGMGIIVLAVAILPMLGIGGMQLYRVEIPGMARERFTPRITETAKSLWNIYLLLTGMCAISYRLAGMEWFDAVGHSFSTVSIGGFSTHNNGLSYYDDPTINMVAIFFMLVAGINFALHFIALNGNRLTPYIRDPECRIYFSIHIVLFLACCTYLIFYNKAFLSLDDTIDVAFQSVSIATTTGFLLEDYGQWPEFTVLLLLFSSFAGACAGSVGGGLKVIRVFLLLKQGAREVFRIIHPNASVSIKISHTGTIPDRVVDAIWGFFSAYVFCFVILMLSLLAIGIDQVTAFSAIAACMNNLGPGLGEVSVTYSSIDSSAKWILVLAMVLGRLEVFTVFALFTSAFWRK